MRFRRSTAERLAPASARRQGDITTMAFVLLGRDPAIAFLNGDNAALGARPLDLAIASDEGCAEVVAELRRMTGTQAVPA
jgi:hypothetical protein